MTDRPRQEHPTELDALIGEWRGNAQRRHQDLHALLLRAQNFALLEDRLNALTPTGEGARLADLARRLGECGLMEISTAQARVWDMALRLPVSGGFVLLKADNGHMFQWKPEQQENTRMWDWRPLASVSDLSPEAAFTLIPADDQQTQGQSVYFTALHSLPDLHTLADRHALTPHAAQDQERGSAPDPADVLTRFTVVIGMVVLIGLAGSLLWALGTVSPAPVVRTTISFLLPTAVVVMIGSVVLLTRGGQGSRDVDAAVPATAPDAPFWNAVERAELSAMQYVFQGQRPLTWPEQDDLATFDLDAEADTPNT